MSPNDTRRVAPWLVMAAILTTQLMIVLDATIVNVALPHIQRALDFTPTSLSWVINAYTLAFGGLLLLGARAGDLLGRRRVLLSGITLFVLASFLGGFAQNAGQLLAARAVQGVGAALAAPSVLALLMARLHTGNFDMLALRNGYHGGNASGMGLTAHSSWKFNVPHAFGVHHAVAPYPYRGAYGYDDPEAGRKYADDVKNLIDYATPGKVAGFIAESTGWVWFFVICALAGLPSLALLAWLQRRGHFKRLEPKTS